MKVKEALQGKEMTTVLEYEKDNVRIPLWLTVASNLIALANFSSQHYF